MSNFTTANLTGERVLVSGTDRFGVEGSTVVSSEEWSEVKARSAHADAHEDFDATVSEFFAPIMAAADKLQSTLARPKVDPISYVVIHEGTEAVQGRDEVAIKLGPDSIVLRLLERGDHDRLVWVNDKLEVLEVLDFDGADDPQHDVVPAEVPEQRSE